ncbi:MAG: hypothetical protein EPN97_01880 [Alphaproteobacteria bacterium]|nr:MAG: hypothetical protein EPN97_01880 [Alphaproteobacteria bacterium]
MTPDVSSALVSEFTQGLEQRNVPLVTAALDSGLQPDTSVNGRHPLLVLMGTEYSDMPQPVQSAMTPAEFNSRTTAILNMLFDKGLKVAEEGKYATDTQAYLADRVLLSDDVDDAASVVIHAIHETLKDGRPAYQPDLPVYIAGLFKSGLISETANYRAIVSGVLEAIGQLHDKVCERLEHPQNTVEQDVSQARGKAEFWVSPYKHPDVDAIVTSIGLIAARRIALAPGELKEKFTEQAEQQEPDVSGYLTVFEKKPPQQVLQEMKDGFVGLDDLKTAAKRMVFRQNYEKACAEDATAAPLPKTNYSTAFIGPEGVGKSTFARKQAELLVALDMAGPNYFEITKENLALLSGSMTPPLMASILAKADVITIELSGGPRDTEGKSLDTAFLASLQMSLKGREKPPVIFLTGATDDMEAALYHSPGVKELIGNFRTIPAPTPEQMAEALDRKLEKARFTIDGDARTALIGQFTTGLKRLGEKGFRNMREVDSILEKLPDVIAERIFGSEESEQPAMTGDDKQSILRTVKAADIKALNLRTVLGGPALAKKRSIGFTADM